MLGSSGIHPWLLVSRQAKVPRALGWGQGVHGRKNTHRNGEEASPAGGPSFCALALCRLLSPGGIQGPGLLHPQAGAHCDRPLYNPVETGPLPPESVGVFLLISSRSCCDNQSASLTLLAPRLYRELHREQPMEKSSDAAQGSGKPGVF